MVKKIKKPPVKPLADTITIEEIVGLSDQIEPPETRCLFCLAYLSGGRIGELLKMRRRDVYVNDSGQIEIKLLTSKNRNHPVRICPVLYKDIKDTKHKTFAKFEAEMVEDILEYIKSLDPNELIFKMTRQQAYKQFSKIKIVVSGRHGTEIIDDLIKKINPHYLRHCRLTHLVSEYNISTFRLQTFAGWSDIQPAQAYVQLSGRDVAEEMKR